MKRLTCLICFKMALVSLSAFAVDADTETFLRHAYAPVTRLCVDFCALACVCLDASVEACINRSGEVVYSWQESSL